MGRALLALAAFAALGWQASALGEEPDAGCVSCHVDAAGEGGSDFRVSALLDRVWHRNGPGKTEIVPTGCNRCHAADDSGAGTPLRKLIHAIHYESPDENRFVTQYGGDCRGCHALNASIGVVTIKAGERNWTPAVYPR